MSEDGSGFQDVSEEDGAEASSPAAAAVLGADAAADRPASPAVSEESVDQVDDCGPRSTRVLSLCAKLRRTYPPSLQVF